MTGSRGPSPTLVIFLDGVGIGPADPGVNPFLNADLPHLSRLLGGTLPTLDGTPLASGPGRLHPLDATLGVRGIPQSGTGQVALFTGVNGPRRFGRHFGPWVPVGLRDLMAESNILRRARDRGWSAAFANAYPRAFVERSLARRPPGPPLAAHGAGLLTRDAPELARGEAVASEIVNDGWIRHLGHGDLPPVTPEEAGVNLASLARAHDLTLFAHYATDHAGHRGGMAGAVRALERVDAFLGGLLGALGSEVRLALVSDHGNVEDVRGGHTRNPALCVLSGSFPRVPRALTDLPALLGLEPEEDP